MSYKFYFPDRSPLPSSIVLGLPGLVLSSETTRVDEMLETLYQQHQIGGVRMTYSGVKEEDSGSIRCHLDLEEDLKELGKIFEEFSRKKEVKKIGILGSSVAAIVIGYYFATAVPNKISCAALISPLLGWPYFATEKARQEIAKRGQDILLDSVFDSSNNLKRYIPKEDLAMLQKIDALSELRGAQKHLSLEVLTLSGREDKVADIFAMQEYHRLLGGKEERFYTSSSGHDIDRKYCYDLIVPFFAEQLQNS